jgi:hypothetical protein
LGGFDDVDELVVIELGEGSAIHVGEVVGVPLDDSVAESEKNEEGEQSERNWFVDWSA